MTDMLTPIVYIFRDESLSYFGFISLMNRYMNSLFDRNQIEINNRLDLFNILLNSIDNELWKKINSNKENKFLIYRWLLLDCKREFQKFHHIIRILEIVWINSILYENNQSLFTIFLSISILEEDRRKILSFSNDEDVNKYFFSSSSTNSRSNRSVKRILQRAQIHYFNYKS